MDKKKRFCSGLLQYRDIVGVDVVTFVARQNLGAGTCDEDIVSNASRENVLTTLAENRPQIPPIPNLPPQP